MTGAVPGPVLFARYAYPPNAMGLCGPGDPDGLLEAAADGADLALLADRAARFDGAWPYLALIARCNRIGDPLDARVVEAYWLGNRLLRAVPAAALRGVLAERFGDVGRSAPVAAATAGAWCQHGFHVLCVSPWLGLLRAGRTGPALDVLDRCRIRAATVVAVAGDTVVTSERPLVWQGSRLGLGPPVERPARRAVDGVGFVAGLRPGDTVAVHWDWVCDRLDDRRRRRLEACTARSLALANAAEPGPAAAASAWAG